MSRIRFVLAVALPLLPFSAAGAQVHAMSGWQQFWSRVGLDFHRMNAWPEPFLTADRHATRCIWIPMIAKGWQYENTLTDYHFDHEAGTLNAAGLAKVRWISTRAPAQRRTIFVLAGQTNDQTEQRVDLVQRAASSVLADGPLPAVVQTIQEPRGMIGTGNYQNMVWQGYQGAMQPPALPGGSAGGGGGQ